MVGSFTDQTSSESLQRTEEWFEKRSGCFTGSNIKKLMSCGRSTSKIGWTHAEKVVDFGSAAEKYIYNVGMERLTGIRSQQAHSKQMEHGTKSEPLLIQQLIDDGVITDFKELGFENFGEYKFGGASVDGVCMYKGELVGLELKCTVSWDGHFSRMYDAIDDKHDDFWQFQSEMIAAKVKKILYVVAMPMQTEKYDLTVIEASPMHQKRIAQRCKIADSAIDKWGKHSKKDALQLACAEFENL
jgi:hypothetical protein